MRSASTDRPANNEAHGIIPADAKLGNVSAERLPGAGMVILPALWITRSTEKHILCPGLQLPSVALDRPILQVTDDETADSDYKRHVKMDHCAQVLRPKTVGCLQGTPIESSAKLVVRAVHAADVLVG